MITPLWWCYDPGDGEWGWYWAVDAASGRRLNGGLASSEGQARQTAMLHRLYQEWEEKDEERRRAD